MRLTSITFLRECQTYIHSTDRDFVAATVQATRRWATNIGRVGDICCHDLVQLLSHCDELVVTESVVIMKKLLQIDPAQHEIIKHWAKIRKHPGGRGASQHPVALQ